MSFVDPSTSKELVLPVTPARYFWRHPTKIEVVSLDQLGEATLHGGYKMGDCTLENVLLPAQQYPFMVPGSRAAPYEYLYDLEVWCDKGAQLQWIVSGTSVNASVLIEEITQGEQDGTNDLNITIPCGSGSGWRPRSWPCPGAGQPPPGTARRGRPVPKRTRCSPETVSYTHLTLPTKLEV